MVAIFMAQILECVVMEIDYVACGFCKNESICKIREEYMKSDEKHSGGTTDLAKRCGKYLFDGRAKSHIWRPPSPQ